jgi:SAM-dependent methyltransferase
MQSDDLSRTLTELAQRYPADLVEGQLRDIPRIAFEIDLVTRRAGRDVALCDIGSGVGLFPVACAALGMRVTIVDDFEHPFGEGGRVDDCPDAPDAVNYDVAETALALHRELGVAIERRDPLEGGLGLPSGSLDVVTSFDSMEHWHRSPKRLFAEAMEALVPGGLFVVGAPNCVNLRKRLTVPLGVGKWSEMSHWYEPERFRGHVREPDVADLRYIARDLGLTDVEILGRNWAGYLSGRRAVRTATAAVDRLLRLRPPLCSDIYLVGRTPG